MKYTDNFLTVTWFHQMYVFNEEFKEPEQIFNSLTDEAKEALIADYIEELEVDIKNYRRWIDIQRNKIGQLEEELAKLENDYDQLSQSLSY